MNSISLSSAFRFEYVPPESTRTRRAFQVVIALLALVPACGRLHFDPLGGDVAGDGGPEADGGFVGRSETYLKPSNAPIGQEFGWSLAMSEDGSTLAVGAWTESSAATGINGNQADVSELGSGAVFVFTRVGATWTQQAYVKASNTGTYDQFGTSVALSADGSTLAVGAFAEASAATGINGNQADNSASQSGAVYVFTRAGATWNQQAYVKASNTNVSDRFGWCVALSSDGNTLAVGASLEASAATGVGGNQADNSAVSAGAVYVLTRAGTAWTQQAYVKASNTNANDQFGKNLALSSDGNTLAVGATHESSAAIGVNGNQSDNSLVESGAVYVFTRAGTTWSQQAYVKASNPGSIDSFGASVAVSSDGNTLAIGAALESSAATGIGGNQADNSAVSAGAVYVLTRAGTTWTQQAYIKASNTDASDALGWNIAISADGNSLAAGAPGEASATTGIGGDQADNSKIRSGAAYMFHRAGTSWTQLAYVKASNTDASDQFGLAVALSGDGKTLAAGADAEASAATGIGGDQTDNSATGAGAVYIIE
ncbi:MAG: Integrin alpha beta-propellor repeat protein [Myxococcales bacterium]|nr:Integrin alpha beta-propellor repeat protein [Myxococcales bacterium]